MKNLIPYQYDRYISFAISPDECTLMLHLSHLIYRYVLRLPPSSLPSTFDRIVISFEANKDERFSLLKEKQLHKIMTFCAIFEFIQMKFYDERFIKSANFCKKNLQLKRDLTTVVMNYDKQTKCFLKAVTSRCDGLLRYNETTMNERKSQKRLACITIFNSRRKRKSHKNAICQSFVSREVIRIHKNREEKWKILFRSFIYFHLNLVTETVRALKRAPDREKARKE